MKFYFAELAETLCGLVCAVSGHAYGCWITSRGPLGWPYRWAVNLRWDDPGPAHNRCPTCHFDRNDYIPRAQWTEDMDRYFEWGEEAGRKAAVAEMLKRVQCTTHGSGAGNTYTLGLDAD